MKSLVTLCSLTAALAFVAGEAHAQTRRPRGAEPEPAVAPAVVVVASSPPRPVVVVHRAPEPASQALLSTAINRPGYHVTRVGVEFFGGVGPGAWAWPWGGFVLSPGLRLSVPLTRNGPVATLNNDLRLMIGAQIYFSVTPIPYWWLSAPITLQWNFFLSEQWSVGLEAGVAIDVFTYDLINCYDHPRLYCDRVGFHPAGGIGLRRHLSSSGPPGAAALSFRFMYPSGVQVGIGF